MGHPVLRTPQIDRLAAGGVLFENNFCATAICCTSRASILSGLFEKSHGVSDFRTPLPPAVERLSYPAVLRGAGYKTGFVGKYGVGGDAAPGHLFDKTYGPPGVEAVGQSRKFGRMAMEFLDGVRAQENFCLSLHFRAPHARDPDPQQYLYDAEEAGLYRDAKIAPPKKAEYFERLPKAVRESESRVRWGWRFTTSAHYEESVKSYYRLIAGVDAVVGEVMGKLAARGLADNTVVIFSSDNGYFLAERGLADKWYAYEESIRTPLIVYDPRLPAKARGKRRKEMTLNLDIGPTMMEAAGVAQPAAVQGRSVMGLVRGEKPRWRKEWMYSHLFPGMPPKVTIPKSEGLRTERWKYVRWVEERPVREEVYDLRSDPEEKVDLVAGKMRARLEERWKKWDGAVSGWKADQVWRDPA